MSQARVAFVTNLCPHYRRPLFEALAEALPTTFFFSRSGEPYPGVLSHEENGFPARVVRRVVIAGNPLLVGLAAGLRPDRYDFVVKCLNGASTGA